MNMCIICNNSFGNEKLINLSNGTCYHISCLKKLESDKKLIVEQTIAIRNEIDSLTKIENSQKGLFSGIMKRITGSYIDNVNIVSKRVVLTGKMKNYEEKEEILNNNIFKVYDYLFDYPPDWEIRRKKILEINGNECENCFSNKNLHVHHIIPISTGGSHIISNLRLLCSICHGHEHTREFEFEQDFRSKDIDTIVRQNRNLLNRRIQITEDAIRLNLELEFEYKKKSDPNYTKRRIIPKKLKTFHHYHGGGSTICVEGYCYLRKAKRTFAFKRMKSMKLLN